MYKNKRQYAILEYIYEKKEATVNELSKKFNVSKVTIRKDLIELESKGKIKKNHGGAIPAEHIMLNEMPYYKKNMTAINEKRKIGQLASKLIQDKQIVIIDNGSTTNEISSFLNDKEIVVVTNDIRIANKLCGYPSMKIVICGGYIKTPGYAVFGSMAEDLFKHTLADICFLSVDSLDINTGLSYNFLESIAIKKQMIRNSNKVIVLCDSSKIGKQSFAKLCDVDKIDVLITDSMDIKLKRRFEEKGVRVLIAK